MKRIGLSLIVLLLTTSAAFGQATKVISSGAVPGSCSNGAVYVKSGAGAGWYVCDTVTHTFVGPYPTSAGAPSTAVYWTGAADAGLSAEKDLSALSTGLVINTAGTPSAYAGGACSAGQFVTNLSASGALTCGTPAGAGGTVTSVATTSPITGGTITTTGTIACATCVTSAAALTSGKVVEGAGSQATAVSTLTATVVKATSGTLSAATAGTDYNAPTTSGTIRQVVNTQTGAVNSGTGVIPYDDSIPQSGEGDEYMTLAITPTSATNKLRIEVVIWLSPSVARFVVAALFQDSTANALAAMAQYMPTGTGNVAIAFSHYMTAGTTSATTFKVRGGSDSAVTTTTFNGQSAGRKLGGSVASSITITEIVP